MTPHRAQCLQPSLWNWFIATLIAHITNSKLRAMCAFYCPSTFNDLQPKPEIQFHFHLCRCFFLFIFCFYVRSMALEIYTERLFKIPNIASKCKYCVCWLVLQEMSKIPMFPDAPIYVMYMLVFAYLQILFAFFLLLHQLPLCWYFCHLDTVFAASLPPFLLTSATRGALVLETQSNYSYKNVTNI